MHPNPVFRDASDERNLAYARERGFGVLCVSGGDAPMLSHVPFVLTDDGAEIELHLVRSNPIARALGQPRQAVLAVSGPDSYVSPDWYEVADQVPTWNYVAVHLGGVLERLPQDHLRGMLDRLSAAFEAKLSPKTPWTADKMDADALDRMMRQIVPCRMRIQSIDGTWKLNQNKPDAVRLNAADKLAQAGVGSETGVLAALMRSL